MPKPHNFGAFKAVLTQVDRMIYCDAGAAVRTVQFATRKDGPIHIHGAGNSIAKITLKDFFIVEVCVVTDDLNQFATRTSVNHGIRLNHSMWWEATAPNAANSNPANRFRPLCSCSIRTFEQDFPNAAISEVEQTVKTSHNWQGSPASSNAINDINNPITFESDEDDDEDDDTSLDLDTAHAKILSLQDENKRLNEIAEKFEACSKARHVAVRQAKQECDEREKEIAETNQKYNDLLQRTLEVHDPPAAGHAEETNQEAFATAAREQHDLDTIKDRYDDVRQKYTDLVQKNDDLQYDFDLFKDDTRYLEKKHGELKEQLAALQQERVYFDNKCEESQKGREAATKQAEDTQKKYDELKKKYVDAKEQSAVSDAHQTKLVQTMRAERDFLQTQLAAAEENLATAETKAAAAEAKAADAEAKAAAAEATATKTQEAIDRYVEVARRNATPVDAKFAEKSAQSAARDAAKKAAALEKVILEKNAEIALHQAALASTEAELRRARGFLDVMREVLGDLQHEDDTTSQKRPASEMTGGIDTEGRAKRVAGCEVKDELRYTGATTD